MSDRICPKCGKILKTRTESNGGIVYWCPPPCNYDSDSEAWLRTFKAFRRVFDAAGNTIGWEDAKNGKRLDQDCGPEHGPDTKSARGLLEMYWLRTMFDQVPAGVL